MRALREKLIDLWRARELVRQFVGKELKVRYKNSVLGFFWSLLTPALMTVVFTVVFGFVIRINVVDFAAFFLTGYIAWQFFNNAVTGSLTAITGSGNLIKKVYFPREVLPLSIVLSQAIHMVLTLVAVLPYLVWTRGWGVLTHLPAVAVGIVLLTIFASGFSMLLAGANVGLRDLQELIVVVFLIWFYATPVIYPVQLVAEAGKTSSIAQFFTHVINLNPMTWFVKLFREALYGGVTTVEGPSGQSTLQSTEPLFSSPELFLAVTGVALSVFVVGYMAFNHFARTFAKEV